MALLAGHSGAYRVQIREQRCASGPRGESLKHAVIVSRRAEIVAVRERYGNPRVLVERRLADVVRDGVAQCLHPGVRRVVRLQVSERRGHACAGDDRAVIRLVASERGVVPLLAGALMRTAEQAPGDYGDRGQGAANLL